MTRLRAAVQDLGWWIRDYVYAGYWQARAVVVRTRSDSFRDGSGSAVVVIPGVYESWRFLQPLIRLVHAAGHPVHVLDFARWNTRPVAEAAAQVVDYLRRHDLRDVTIVAHSKGGLIGKYAMTTVDGAERMRGMVAVAAPFAGSRYARYLVAPSLRMFRPRDPTIVALELQREVNARIVSLYGRFDPHIPGGSSLAGARNVELDTGGHFRVLAHPRVIAEVLAAAA